MTTDRRIVTVQPHRPAGRVEVVHIAVTGGSGKLGRVVVADLVAHGHTVVNLDRDPPPGRPARGRRFLRTDLTDHGQVLEALLGVDEHHRHGVDALVHLAAVPAPGWPPTSATFENNILSTYSAFAAARAAGIHNVVWASSETVLGLPFDEPPPYAPGRRGLPTRARTAATPCPRRSARRWRRSSAAGTRT